MILVLFGLPGTGKTYVGNLLKDEFNFSFYDGDADLTPKMKKAIKEKRVFTDQMRDIFFRNVSSRISRLQKKHKRLVIAQTFIKERYRISFLKRFPKAQFILIKTERDLREERLTNRNTLDLAYTYRMVKLFEKPRIKHAVIENNQEGKHKIKRGIQSLLQELAR